MADEFAEPPPLSSGLPPMPLLPSPTVIARLLAAAPPSPARSTADDALRAFTRALAERWAAERYAAARAEPQARAEGGAVHIFRMVDSGWRFASDPDAIRGLRRALMPDGVGHELYRDWPQVLAWLEALVGALLSPMAAPARARHLGRMLDFFVEEVDNARAVSPPLPVGGDGPVVAAGQRLESALLDLLEACIAAGVDVERLVLAARNESPSPARRDERPVEPDAGRPQPASEPPSEAEDVDE